MPERRWRQIAVSDRKSDATARRQRYEALRLAQWAIVDAITAAGHIASRASDCFEGGEYTPFNAMREAIGKLAAGPEMREIKSLVHNARMAL
jgi:hypothetical protein